MWLSADVGGTKSLIGVFAPGASRPTPRIVREYATLDFESLLDLISTFLDETGATGIRAAAFGVAGPVNGLVARMVNVPWVADAAPVGEALNCPVALLNDLEAMAHAVPVLEPDELATLQEGILMPNGNAALIAAGTGLGDHGETTLTQADRGPTPSRRPFKLPRRRGARPVCTTRKRDSEKRHERRLGLRQGARRRGSRCASPARSPPDYSG